MNSLGSPLAVHPEVTWCDCYSGCWRGGRTTCRAR